MAHKTIVRPTLEYAGIAWDPHSQKHIKILERIHTLAVRFMFSCYDRKRSVTTLIQKAGHPKKHSALEVRLFALQQKT